MNGIPNTLLHDLNSLIYLFVEYSIAYSYSYRYNLNDENYHEWIKSYEPFFTKEKALIKKHELSD